MNSLTVLTVTLHNEELVTQLIKSFQKFKPKDLNINYIIVENSDNISYKDQVCSLDTNLTWLQNPLQPKLVPGGSWAHGRALNLGIENTKDDWVFICDSDTLVVSSKFFDELFLKVNQGYDLIGVSYDPNPNRIGAVHPSGLLVKTSIASKVNMIPVPEKNWDTANEITAYVRENNLKHYVFRNTWNDESLVDLIDYPYNEWGSDGIDRCLDSENNIMFLHLGRGTAKSGNLHWKDHRLFDAKVGYDRWISFCEDMLND